MKKNKKSIDCCIACAIHDASMNRMTRNKHNLKPDRKMVAYRLRVDVVNAVDRMAAKTRLTKTAVVEDSIIAKAKKLAA